MPDKAPIQTYVEADFALPKLKQCDLVMKGGVTSGIVYPYALLELARAYQFRSIGGTSAGAIAAAFAAAAEYARTVRNDPAGFLRMQALCETLPDILGDLFQPSPRLAALMRWLLAAQAGRPILGGLRAFWVSTLIGLGLGAAMFFIPGGGIIAGLSGLVMFPLLLVAARILWLLLHTLPRSGFGLCPGLTQRGGKGQGLTDWLHRALQEIAFGDPAHAKPLTFGDLTGLDPDKPQVDLRMVTTNLSMRRPHTLPRMGAEIAYDPGQWTGLFPKAVLAHMAGATQAWPHQAGALEVPQPQDLPVLVAVRMSLSFPFLFQAIPMLVRDIESRKVVERTGGPAVTHVRTVLFSDGGISSNFPIHLFDALLPTRPTFALSLDELPEGAVKTGERVFFPEGAADGVGVPVQPIKGFGGFAMSILGAAKDWQDQLLGGMPGQRERIARIYLDADEGGLNLTMPADRSAKLMGYGCAVGAGFAAGKLDFDEHRWRRTLVAYAQLERTIAGVSAVWTPKDGYGAWYTGYQAQAQSYGNISKIARTKIGARIDAFADLGKTFKPPVYDPKKFPRPMGRLRISPDV
jgi:predicted acylesterase/phospholipase RssA